MNAAPQLSIYNFEHMLNFMQIRRIENIKIVCYRLSSVRLYYFILARKESIKFKA